MHRFTFVSLPAGRLARAAPVAAGLALAAAVPTLAVVGAAAARTTVPGGTWGSASEVPAWRRSTPAGMPRSPRCSAPQWATAAPADLTQTARASTRHSRPADRKYDLIVIGGGAAGLAAAHAGAGARARTLLVSEGEVGGECTFTGCVPSKTLIEAAARSATFAEAIAACARPWRRSPPPRPPQYSSITASRCCAATRPSPRRARSR